MRQVVGLRNSGHTIAKLLAGCSSGRTLRVVNYTHPEYGTRLAEFIAETRADVLLMRGTEGEPVADARRLQKMDIYLGGIARPELSLPGRPASSPSCRCCRAAATRRAPPAGSRRSSAAPCRRRRR